MKTYHRPLKNTQEAIKLGLHDPTTVKRYQGHRVDKIVDNVATNLDNVRNPNMFRNSDMAKLE